MYLRFSDTTHYLTVASALDTLTNEDLRQLAKPVGVPRVPTRKAERVELISGHLVGDELRQIWELLDPL